MKKKPSVTAPLFVSVLLVLAGLSAQFETLLTRLSEDAFLSAAIIQLLTFLLPLSFYCVVRSFRVSALPFSRVQIKKIPFLFVMGLLLFGGMIFLRYIGLFFFHESMVETPGIVYLGIATENKALLLICEIFLPALLEEVVFRGVLLEEYARFGRRTAVWMTALFFAMAHLSFENFFFFLFIGVMLGAVTAVTGSLYPAIALHVLINFSNFYLRADAVEYVRQVGKTALFPYILIGLLILGTALVFARLEDLYRDRSYDQMLQSRKEILRREAEKNDEKEEAEKRSPFDAIKDIFLSPTLYVCVAVFVLMTLDVL